MLGTLYTSIEILGGLGNQLFQIAFILHFLKMSRQQNRPRELVFKDVDDVGNKYQLPRKAFWNTLFKDQFNVLQDHDYTQLVTNCITYKQGEHHKFEQLPYDTNNSILFQGYFQSFKYIDDDIRDQMINHIYSNEDVMYKAYEKYNDIKRHFGTDTQDDDMISVHIRRTDYVWDSTYHHNLYLDYYKTALQMANKKYVVVFSDDIDWCKKNIAKNLYQYDNIYFVDSKHVENNVEIDFILMSMFQHNVIANSTYSLWASFISSYKNKIVIAPKNWYSQNGPQKWDEVYHKYITHII